MKKAHMGLRLRRLREERGLTQAAFACALELSPSYLKLMEQNQRPLAVQSKAEAGHAFGGPRIGRCNDKRYISEFSRWRTCSRE